MRVLTVMLSSLVALAVAEVGLAVFRPVEYAKPSVEPPGADLLHQPSSVPGLAYELAPNREGYFTDVLIQTNSHGMRDSEPLPQSDRDVYRIVALGDSFTFGSGVPSEEIYPQVLEARLNAHGAPRSDVLNFAVSGYSTRDEALMLRHRALAWDPDLVLIGYVLNDPAVDGGLHGYFSPVDWWQQFNLLRAFAAANYLWNLRRFGDGDHLELLHARPADWQSVMTAFADIRCATRPRGVPVLVVIFPKPEGEFIERGRRPVLETWSDYRYPGLHRQVAGAARRFGFDVIDLLHVFSDYPPEAVVVDPGGDDHPNAVGHALAARAIHEWLLGHS